jgi:hypothetical protein
VLSISLISHTMIVESLYRRRFEGIRNVTLSIMNASDTADVDDYTSRIDTTSSSSTPTSDTVTSQERVVRKIVRGK